MSLQLFGHPFSSYTMKALIALYENDTPFDFRMLDPDHPENGAELARRWPVARFPLLVDGGTTVFETSAIIEHLAAFHTGPVPLIPADAKAAVAVRMLDRVFDSHVMGPMQAIVLDSLRPEEARDPYGVKQARTVLDTIYAWLDHALGGRQWAAAMLSRWRTQLPRLRCSMPTGRTRSARIAPCLRPIAHACSRAHRLRAASTTLVPIGPSSLLAPLIETASANTPAVNAEMRVGRKSASLGKSK